MKRCPKCNLKYDDTLSFCLEDGTGLIGHKDTEETLVLPSTQPQPTLPVMQFNTPVIAHEPVAQRSSNGLLYAIILFLAIFAASVTVAFFHQRDKPAANAQIQSTSPTTQNQIPAQQSRSSPTTTVNQNTAVVRNSSQVQMPVVTTSDYATENVRAGTADGKRLRVVVDLTRTSLNTGSPARFETLPSVGASGEARILVYAQNDSVLSVKYESKQTRKLGTVYLSPPGQGLEVKVVPQSQLYLRDVFFIPRGSANPNDRLVIDLCINEGCPSLRP